jgi:anti-sigma factor RsiW
MMGCRVTRERLSARVAGRLDAREAEQVAAHLEECADCRRAELREAELSAVLDRLPRYRAPESLTRRLESLVAGAVAPTPAPAVPETSAAPEPTSSSTSMSTASPGPTSRPSPAGSRRVPSRSTWAASLVSACAAAALAFVVGRAMPSRLADRGASASSAADLLAEAVNDHLRVVSSSHPVEIESGGIHQVKPWFTGRLDFAPRVSFSGDGDFALVGGSVGYFRDRKAAVFVFKRRLHTITLLVFPPEGLGWPTEGLTRLGRLSLAHETSRGFSVLMWRDGGLGYVLVSDVNRHDLELLSSRINPE